MYLLIYDICFSFSELLLFVWQSLGLSTSLKLTLFYGWVIFHCVYAPNLYLFVCQWTFKSLPCPAVSLLKSCVITARRLLFPIETNWYTTLLQATEMACNWFHAYSSPSPQHFCSTPFNHAEYPFSNINLTMSKIFRVLHHHWHWFLTRLISNDLLIFIYSGIFCEIISLYIHKYFKNWTTVMS